MAHQLYNVSMDNKLVLIYYKVGFALLSLYAVLMQLVYLQKNLMLNAGNFFSFFTIESNIFAALVLLVSAWFVYAGKRSKTLDYIRGAATLYMVVTGLVYSLLLAGADVQTPIPFVNAVLHYVFPVVVLVDWLIDRPAKKVPSNVALVWLIFPLAYVAYSLVRGNSIGWYPYPFLDVSVHGYVTVGVISAILAIGMAVMAWVIARLSYMNKQS